MLMEKGTTKPPRCVSKSERVDGEIMNKPYLFMSCFDAIIQNDAREVFILEHKTIK